MRLTKPALSAVLVALLLTVACSGVEQSPAAAPTSPTTTPRPTTTTTPSFGRTSCATADGVNDACACDTDCQLYCSGFYTGDWESWARARGYTTASWKLGLVDCLGQHTVSSACRASLDRRETLNARMMSACQTYCRGTTPKPGEEPCVDHLKSIYQSLDNACRSALDAHEGAKALQGQGPL